MVGETSILYLLYLFVTQNNSINMGFNHFEKLL